jgi:hypothetical protein
MMRLMAGLLVAAVGTTSAGAQGASREGPSWVGRQVAITSAGRRLAPACPNRAQAEHYHKERSLKFDKASVGCVIMRAGNFDSAAVVADSGEYVRVNFRRTKPNRDKVLWVPRASLVLVP